jgi:hypothetical protein
MVYTSKSDHEARAFITLNDINACCTHGSPAGMPLGQSSSITLLQPRSSLQYKVYVV